MGTEMLFCLSIYLFHIPTAATRYYLLSKRNGETSMPPSVM